MLRIVSLGAGVQSSAMLLMALDGRFGEIPDCAIFADTQWEPRVVYEWLDRLEREVAPFPIHRVTNGNIRGMLRGEGRRVALPFYMAPNRPIDRQCTDEYKLKPVRREMRRLGATMGNPCELWIGISTDEAHRMKPSQRKYAVNRFPLIEAHLSRTDCSSYLVERVGETAPRSSCIGCPFHSDAEWGRLKGLSPKEWDDAVAFDEECRSFPGLHNAVYLHRSARPLANASLLHEHQTAMFFDGFGNECEGLCGL